MSKIDFDKENVSNENHKKNSFKKDQFGHFSKMFYFFRKP